MCGTLACVVLLLVLAGLWCGSSFLSPPLPRVIRSVSPTDQGIAVFVRQGKLGHSRVSWYVYDPARGTQPIEMALDAPGSGGGKMQSVAWSRDGTIIAARGGGVLVAGYDLRAHRNIGRGTAARRRSPLIAAAMARAGGTGPTALRSPEALGFGYGAGGEELKEFAKQRPQNAVSHL